MPHNSSSAKLAAVRAYGGEITLCEPTVTAREAAAARIVAATGAVFVHPYDDPDVIAGQGTIALELLEQVPALDWLLCPIGGGGLASGLGQVFRVRDLLERWQDAGTGRLGCRRSRGLGCRGPGCYRRRSRGRGTPSSGGRQLLGKCHRPAQGLRRPWHGGGLCGRRGWLVLCGRGGRRGLRSRWGLPGWSGGRRLGRSASTRGRQLFLQGQRAPERGRRRYVHRMRRRRHRFGRAGNSLCVLDRSHVGNLLRGEERWLRGLGRATLAGGFENFFDTGTFCHRWARASP